MEDERLTILCSTYGRKKKFYVTIINCLNQLFKSRHVKEEVINLILVSYKMTVEEAEDIYSFWETFYLPSIEQERERQQQARILNEQQKKLFTAINKARNSCY